MKEDCNTKENCFGYGWPTKVVHETGELEVKLNLGAEQPIEIWLVFPSGNKSNLCMNVSAAKDLIAKIEKLIKTCEST